MPLKEFTSKLFVGREREIGIIRNAALKAGSGVAGSIILFGRRGAGKTELLKHAFSELFSGQDRAIPFFYTVSSSFTGLERLCQDYFSHFVLQSLAFIRKDPALVSSGIYHLEDLKKIAGRSGESWAEDMIDRYLHVSGSGDPFRLFSAALSAPRQCYRATGKPVVVIIDDFHKIRPMVEHTAGTGGDLWTCLEEALKFQFTPHIIAGFQTDLRAMFFEQSPLGEHLEILNLSGLGRDQAFALFRDLCGIYELEYAESLKNHIGFFNGSPFYIKSFVQAARQTVSSVREDNFWDIYFREVTNGKTSTYWTSILKASIPRFQLRRPALNVLYQLSTQEGGDVVGGLAERLGIDSEELDHLTEMLDGAGTIDMGFSTMSFTDDSVLADVVRGLYHREVLAEPSEKIKDALLGDKGGLEPVPSIPAFDITIPPIPNAESVAIQSLEKIARYFEVPPDVTGQLQVALVHLFSGLASGGTGGERCRLRFMLKDGLLSAELSTPGRGLALTEEDKALIEPYVNNIIVEDLTRGSRIVLFKSLNTGLASAS
ncbi:MAG: ATP-binding protein [Nitrospiraceae bacterium]|nr:MAG: ATP-binding protein [Nitrospiraceae bacterium]